MIRPSLRWEIIATLTIAMMASSFLISLVVMSITRGSLVDQKTQNTATLISFFQHSVDSICYGSEEVFQNGTVNWQVQRLVKLFTMERDVEALFVTDKAGRVIASDDSNTIGTTIIDKDLKEAMNTSALLTHISESPHSFFRRITDDLTVSAPLFHRNEVIGAIRMRLSLADIQRVFSTSFRIIVFYIVFTSIIIVVFGSYLLSRAVVRPLQKLVGVTEAIGKGDFNQPVTTEGRDEVGQLSLAFNRMADRVSEHQRELRSKIESLERLNRDLKQSQKEVLAGEKLALVGKLSAGVAHEIGNPLSAVLGYINLLQKKQEQAPEALDYLDRMEKELLRINKTIRGLLDFSRLETTEIREVDMRKVLDNSLSLVAHQGKFRTIKLTTFFDDELWPVEGEENQFQQVLLNLLLNASDVVADDGSITVLADRMTYSDGELRACQSSEELWNLGTMTYFGLAEESIQWDEPLPFFDQQPVLRIVVADNGTGIAPEHLVKIFDPFFTTKEPGKGTGLGLAICTRIVESYGGVLSARSQEGVGTAFVILLPGKGNRHE